MAYVCFIVDAFSRRIVGWRVASNMRTDMVLDALEMARRSRGGRRLVGLVAHADAGRSSPRCASPNASTRSAPARRSAPSLTATTTPSPRRPTGSTRPSASTGPTPPAMGRRRRARARHPVLGALVQRGAAPQPLRRRATRRVRSSVLRCPTDRPRPGLESNSPSLHQTQGGSPFVAAGQSQGALRSQRLRASRHYASHTRPLRGIRTVRSAHTTRERRSLL
jgi:hypothetical protein